MQPALFANPPPLPFCNGLVVGLVLSAGIVAWLMAQRPTLGWRRLLFLSAFALVCGVAAGAAVGGAGILFGDVDPMDRRAFFVACSVVGTVAGVLGGVLVAVVGGTHIMVRARRRGFARSPSDSTRKT